MNYQITKRMNIQIINLGRIIIYMVQETLLIVFKLQLKMTIIHIRAIAFYKMQKSVKVSNIPTIVMDSLIAMALLMAVTKKIVDKTITINIR